MTQAMKTSDPTDECTRSLCLKQSDRLIESNSDTIRDSVQMGDCLDRGCSHVENGSGDRDVQCLIDRVDDPFLILRSDGGIIYANATFSKSFEYCEKEFYIFCHQGVQTLLDSKLNPKLRGTRCR